MMVGYNHSNYTYCCGICHQIYELETDVLNCENKHKTSQDLAMGEFQFKENREVLDRAATIKGQTKL